MTTEGQRQLVATGLSLAKIAARIGVGRGTIARWKSGAVKPKDENRTALRDEFGIPLDAWDDPKPAKPAPAAPSGPPAPDYPPRPPMNAPQLEHVRWSLECVRIDLTQPGWSPTARSKLRNDEDRKVALVLKLEREREMAEDRYVREHPAFKRHCERIRRALRPYPEAAKAVAKALKP